MELCGQKFRCHLMILTVMLGCSRALSLTSSVEEAGRHAVCPGEEVVFTCSVRQAVLLEWNSDSFPDTNDPVRFLATSVVGLPITRGEFQANLTSLTNTNGQFADMTSTLTVVANDTLSLNGTVVNCTEITHFDEQGTAVTVNESRRLHIAAPPTITLPGYRIQQYGSENATIVVEWGEPEENGWVPVNYTISVSGLGVSTTVNISQEVLVLPYDMPLNIIIVATNCAGSSNATLVEYFIANCGDPSIPINGTIEPYTNTTGGAVIFFECLQGFAPAGRMSSTCVSSGSWSPDPADLNCTLVDCGDPSIPDNGTIQEYQNTTLGSEIFFRCLTGFAPVETERATCEESGRWNPDPVDHNCALVDCGLPRPPANGSVTLQDPDSTTFGAVVMIHCDEGLVLEGNFTRAVCSESGVWIPDPSGLECIPAETDMSSTTGSGGFSDLQFSVTIGIALFILLVVITAIIVAVLVVMKEKGKYAPSNALHIERGTDLYIIARNGMEDNQDSEQHHPTDEMRANGDRPHLNDDTHYSSRLSSELVHSADKKLNLDSVLLQLREIHDYWYQLGEALGVPTFILEEVSFQALPSENSMQVTVDYWLRGHSGQPTWLEIAEALKEINFNHLSRSIRQVYITGSLPVMTDAFPPEEDVPPPIPSRGGESPELPLLPGHRQSTKTGMVMELTTPTGDTEMTTYSNPAYGASTGRARAPPEAFAVEPNPAYRTVNDLQGSPIVAVPNPAYRTVNDLQGSPIVAVPNPAYRTVNDPQDSPIVAVPNPAYRTVNDLQGSPIAAVSNPAYHTVNDPQDSPIAAVPNPAYRTVNDLQGSPIVAVPNPAYRTVNGPQDSPIAAVPNPEYIPH